MALAMYCRLHSARAVGGDAQRETASMAREGEGELLLNMDYV